MTVTLKRTQLVSATDLSASTMLNTKNSMKVTYLKIYSNKPSLNDYRTAFMNSGRDTAFIENLVDGLAKSSLYDSQAA